MISCNWVTYAGILIFWMYPYIHISTDLNCNRFAYGVYAMSGFVTYQFCTKSVKVAEKVTYGHDNHLFLQNALVNCPYYGIVITPLTGIDMPITKIPSWTIFYHGTCAQHKSF